MWLRISITCIGIKAEHNIGQEHAQRQIFSYFLWLDWGRLWGQAGKRGLNQLIYFLASAYAYIVSGYDVFFWSCSPCCWRVATCGLSVTEDPRMLGRLVHYLDNTCPCTSLVLYIWDTSLSEFCRVYQRIWLWKSCFLCTGIWILDDMQSHIIFSQSLRWKFLLGFIVIQRLKVIWLGHKCIFFFCLMLSWGWEQCSWMLSWAVKMCSLEHDDSHSSKWWWMSQKKMLLENGGCERSGNIWAVSLL